MRILLYFDTDEGPNYFLGEEWFFSLEDVKS
jgi:hypothetical protein